jgi:beta-lactamase regulating signal transducer with metallopeptidase domain
MKHLPPGSAFLPKPDETRERSIRLCQEKHVILITADLGYTPALDSDAGGAWGVILLPDDLSLRLTSCRAKPHIQANERNHGHH